MIVKKRLNICCMCVLNMLCMSVWWVVCVLCGVFRVMCGEWLCDVWCIIGVWVSSVDQVCNWWCSKWCVHTYPSWNECNISNSFPKYILFKKYSEYIYTLMFKASRYKRRDSLPLYIGTLIIENSTVFPGRQPYGYHTCVSLWLWLLPYLSVLCVYCNMCVVVVCLCMWLSCLVCDLSLINLESCKFCYSYR